MNGVFPFVPPPPHLLPAGECAVEIMRLLDMPISEKFMSSDLKQYRVRAFDDNNGEPWREVGRTVELVGIPDSDLTDADTETIRLGPEGILRFETQSPIIHMQVEYAGGFFGNSSIGRCRIARADQRSSKIWPYALSNKTSQLVGCGIELKVIEGGGVPGAFTSSGETQRLQAAPIQRYPGLPGHKAGTTFTTASVKMGDTRLPVDGHQGFEVGQRLVIDAGARYEEINELTGFGSLLLMTPLKFDHRAGTNISVLWQDQAMPPGMPTGPPFQTMPPMGPGMMPSTMPPSPVGQGSFPPPDAISFQTMPQQQWVSKGPAPQQWASQGDMMMGTAPAMMGGTAGAQPSGNTMMPQTMAPPLQPEMFPNFMPPTGRLDQQFPPSASVDVNVLAVINIDKIVDIPPPASGGSGEVVLTLERAQGAHPPKQLASAGPFPTESTMQGNLRMVENCKAKLVARVTLEDLANGAGEFRVSAHYKASWYEFGASHHIGTTMPLSVSWKPQQLQYSVLLEDSGTKKSGGYALPVGGIYVSYRLDKDSEELDNNESGPVAPEQAKPVDIYADHNGVSGKFKKNSQDEVLEFAALAVEAQNRALIQRINIAKTAAENLADAEKETSLVWAHDNGYRDWADLDSVFVTMGPNYVAQSLDPICKVYEENTSVYKELCHIMGTPKTVQEEENLRMLIYSMHKKNPQEMTSTLRPIICKDVSNIPRGELTAEQQKPTLRVKVHKALNLRSKEGFLNGMVHPRVIVDIPGKPASQWSGFGSSFGAESDRTGGLGDGAKAHERFETTHGVDGKNVVWDQEGIIKGYNVGDDLRIMVVDKEWVGFDIGEHLGEARLSSADFYPDGFFAQIPLYNGHETKSNTNPSQGEKGACILLEVKVIEPLGKATNWPPNPAMYAPLKNMNVTDQETQRLANWDEHQWAKLCFHDVNSKYQVTEDIWGGHYAEKGCKEGVLSENHADMGASEWKRERVKDDCLMA